MESRHTAVLLALALTVLSCKTTKPAHTVVDTGFLGPDAALLVPGGEGQAARIYLRPDVDWASYTNILLDPVTVWRSPDASQGISAQDAQTLTDYFYQVIREALEAQGFTLVASPMAHTARVKVAITKAGESHVVLDVVSTVVPSARAASALGGLIAGRPAFTGEGQVEAKVTDAVTGQLLAAAIDHRFGGKTISSSSFNSWGDVERMMRLWASHGAYNLCRRQGRTNCVEPSS